MTDEEPQEFLISEAEDGLPVVPLDDDGRMHDGDAFDETRDPKDDLLERSYSRWRNAKANIKLRDQVNAKFPNRKKSSDGTIGDSNHCPGSSDHCPNVVVGDTGVVTAIDITHDPDSGCDAHAIADALLASKDVRIKYIISNGRIGSSYSANGNPAWEWRDYSGSNPHTKHLHLSVLSQASQYDNTNDWEI